jgi:hypothetical protein
MKPLQYGLTALATAVIFAPLGARAYTYHKLYDFCSQASCADGAHPFGKLLLDSMGNLYGTTGGVGINSDTGHSVVFELANNGGSYSFQVLYDFGVANTTEMLSGLIADKKGNLYGILYSGGSGGGGAVFELTKTKKNNTWSPTILHAFCSADPSCPDGQLPSGELSYQDKESGTPYDGRSPLYGVTEYGGPYGVYGGGVAYRISGGKHDTYTVLHNFCSPQDCSDGANPSGDLIADAGGNLFGTTQELDGPGTVFELSPSGSGYNLTTLYGFCDGGIGTGCPDGYFPRYDSLTLNSDGSLLGTTLSGGASCGDNINNDPGSGVIFKLVPNGANSEETVLWPALCPSHPDFVKLQLDAAGNIFWVSQGDLSTAAGNVGENGATVYTFCHQANCADGWVPAGGVAIDPAGNLFGTASEGGANHKGVVYELSP